MIEMFRGDTKVIKFKIYENEDDGVWSPSTGDKIYFSCKHSGYDLINPAIMKVYPNDIEYDNSTNTFKITINPDDTKDIKLGTYDYDIELVRNDGYTKTLIIDEIKIKRDVSTVHN